jgi:hypothetical protein
MESRLPQGLDLHLEALCGVEILAADGQSLLLLECGKLLPDRVQPVDCVLDLLGEVKVLVPDGHVLLLLELFDLEGGLRVKSLVVDELG